MQAMKMAGTDRVTADTTIQGKPRADPTDARMLDLRDWESIHAMDLVPMGADRPDDVYALVDLPGMNYHMIRRACPERVEANSTSLVIEVRTTAECSTNLVVHEYGDTCIAIIDVAQRRVLGGLASTLDLVSLQPLEDGWLKLKIRLPLGRSFHVYLGTADGLRLFYDGHAQPQFLIRNTILLGLKGHRDLRAKYPELKPDNPFVIVDVGASGGLQEHWDRLLLSNAGESVRAYLVEPSHSAAEHLSVLYRPFPNVRVIERALGAENHLSDFYITQFADCTSALRPNEQFLRTYSVRSCFEVVRVEKHQCTTLAELVQSGEMERPDFMKIDVQGLEYEVLRGCGSCLYTCLGIELETHFYPVYENQRLIGDVIALLDTFGFRLRKLQPQHNFDADLVEVNAIFTRDPQTIRDDRGLAMLNLINTVMALTRHKEGAALATMFPSPGP